MFYSEFILTKKGPLAKVWLAAHWDKKLNKQTIASLNLEKSVKSIVDPSVPIALRTNGHLLLGVVKIYSRKVKYVLAECNETLTKIKLQAKTKDVTDENINMPVQHMVATKNQITLPEVSDLDLLLLPNAAAITLELGENWQANIKDITLVDYAAWSTEESIEPVSLEVPTTPGGPGVTTPLSVEAQRALSTGLQPPSTGGVMLGDKAFEQGINIQQIMQPFGGPGEAVSPGGEPMQFGEIGGLGGIGFEEPIEPTREERAPQEEQPEEEEAQPTKKRKRRPGKLIHDDPTSYTERYYTKRLKEHNDLLTERNRAPATREEYEQVGRALPSRDIWKQAPFHMDLPLGFIDFFSTSIDKSTSKEKPTKEKPGAVPTAALTPDERERARATITPGVTPGEGPLEIGGFGGGFDMGGPTEVFGAAAEPTIGRPRATMGPGELSPIAADLDINEDINDMLITATASKTKTPLTDQRKKQIIEDKNRIEKELREKAAATPQVRVPGVAVTTPSPAGVTERTVKVLAMLEEGFKQADTDTLSLTEMLQGRKRQTAARCFYETLVLKSKGLIDVAQSEPFGEILIRKVD
ncbi:hypothetical protein C9374_005983 [Naegleria lovaniensis]|uniref:Double-strand-break repair protein rad21 n=1 Tax=Naegleria lovaniensis TaxID=51637 RepID=A0AA88GII0_NAELO|nr:uncharacterized protein C9374_014733 [Naegleria lovaniensis]XP_044547279.1 uncharacterized protein C9374_005983 [Naegleria lovaniensis]KAG2370631.1 hypothetical protein C9374_014733 [Naegleria lovaniensis]KAG2381599.1 hypothetical protein C9374_005983 [Naegleria lovaniensis]